MPEHLQKRYKADLSIRNYDTHTLSCPIDFTNSDDPEEVCQMIRMLINEAYLEFCGQEECEMYIKLTDTLNKAFIYLTDSNFYRYLTKNKIVNGMVLGPRLLKLSRMSVPVVGDEKMSNILKCKNVNIDLDIIKARFIPFASDSVTKQTRYIKGTKIQDTYPFVSSDNDNVVFVVFDPDTTDAQFALIFNGIITIGDDTLRFEHSWRASKDVKTELKRKRNERSELKGGPGSESRDGKGRYKGHVLRDVKGSGTCELIPVRVSVGRL